MGETGSSGSRDDGVSKPVNRESDAFASDPSAVYAFVGRFFHALAAAGVEHVVISPGSRSTPLAVSAGQVRGLRTWIQLDERAAAFFALGLAKESGRPAVLVCTSGTAAANYLPAIVEAHYSRVPMIVATADRPPEWRDWGVGQTIEQAGLFGSYPRWSVEVPVPEAGPDARRYASQLAARAVESASASPAGAVHLNWPLREPLAPSPGDLQAIRAAASDQVAGPHFSHARRIADSEDVRTLATLARRYERGVLCCGPMELNPALRAAITAFSDAAGWPVLADPTSNLRSEFEPQRAPVLACGDVMLRASGFAGAMRPEVILRLGETPVSKAQRLWIEQSDPAEVIWFDEGGQWGEPSHRATRVFRGGSSSLLASAAADLSALPSEAASIGAEGGFGSALRQRAWCREFEAAEDRARRAIDEMVRAPEAWSGVSVAATVARVAPAGSLLFSSNSMSIRLLDLAMATRAPSLRVLCNRGASGIDGVTSSALGGAASSDQPAILLTGDLAFLHDLSGLLIARRESIRLTIVVIDDNGGGIFSFLPIAAQAEEVGFNALFHTPHDLDLQRIAGLFELDYCAVRDVETLERAITESIKRVGVSIVHAPLGAEENAARFRAAVARGSEAVASIDVGREGATS